MRNAASLFAPVSLLLIVMGGLLATSAQAQEKPSPSVNDAAPVPTPPPDVLRLMSYVADLDLLKALVPLRLTADQITRLLVPLRETLEGLEKQRTADYTALRALTGDLEKARAEALRGVPVPQELESRLLKTFNDSASRAEKTKQELIRKTTAATRDIFTAEQKDEIERQVGKMLGGKRLIPAAYKDDPSKAPKVEVQGLALGMFLERILLNERAAFLLERLKISEPPASSDAAPADTRTP